MRVLLVSHHQGALPGRKGPVYDRPFPPVELANLAALLRAAGHEVALLDAALRGLGPARVAREARGFDRAVISASNLDRWCCPEVDAGAFTASARALVDACPETFLIGAHPTALPAVLLRATGARAAVLGEPEGTAAALVEAKDPEGIAGAAWLDAGGALRRGPPRPPLALDAQPVPAYDLLRGAYRYELLGGRFMVFEYSRGCPFHCGFCHRAMYGEGFRPKPLERLWAEIERARAVLGIRTAYFMDLEFTAGRERVLALCERLDAAGRPLRWCCQTRVDQVDRPLLQAMRGAGCELVHFGIEAGSQRLLDEVGKGTTLAQAEQAVAWCRELGLRSACFFLAGLPGQSRAELEGTLRFALALDPTYASFHVAVPYPGTRLHAALASPPEDRFPTHLSDEHDLEELEAWVHRAFRRFYLRPGYALRRAASRDLWQAGRLARIFLWYLR